MMWRSLSLPGEGPRMEREMPSQPQCFQPPGKTSQLRVQISWSKCELFWLHLITLLGDTIITICCFKPLNCGIVCYAAVQKRSECLSCGATVSFTNNPPKHWAQNWHIVRWSVHCDHPHYCPLYFLLIGQFFRNVGRESSPSSQKTLKSLTPDSRGSPQALGITNPP